MPLPDPLQTLRDLFAECGTEVVAAYLFGSLARGEATAVSDVDVAVLLRAGRPQRLADYPSALLARMEARLGRRVDLVLLDGAPPDLAHRVLRDGILLHESDRAARIEYEVQARNEYWDILPMLERHRRAVLDSA